MRVRRSDVAGIAWVIVSGWALLIPALAHGGLFGPYGQLASYGLTAHHAAPPRVGGNSDLINSLIPWSALAWQQVHQGHLPIWNPYGGLGLPLAFNWQSGAFSLPALVGYLVPMHAAFTVGVFVDLFVAGTGAYALGRILGLSAVGSATIGTVFQLSGPFAAWLGYPFPSVMSWAGWIVGFGILLVRGRHKARDTTVLAVCVAMAIYGGQPEGVAALMVAVVVFFAVALIARAGWLGGSGPILRPGLRLAGAGLAGGALAAPLALPALQVTAKSVRGSTQTVAAPSLHYVTYLAFQGFDGLPIRGVYASGQAEIFYTEFAAYVGIAALVLAGCAMAVRWRRPEVKALGATALVCLLLAYFEPLDRVLNGLPLVGQVQWTRALMPLAFVLAVLAGIGVDAVAKELDPSRSARWLLRGFGTAGVGVGALWIFSRDHLWTGTLGTHAQKLAVRSASFVWPAATVAVGLACAALLWGAARTGRRAHVRRDPETWRGRSGSQHPVHLGAHPGATVAVVLLVIQTVFLVTAGAPVVQSSPSYFPSTPATNALVATVGRSTVGFGASGCHLGIEPNVNIVYAVDEMAVYDPILPGRYFSAWESRAGTSPGITEYNYFCPEVPTVSVAREFGIGYILEPEGAQGPAGSQFVRLLDHESIWKVPGSGAGTLTPLVAGGLPPDAARGIPIPVDRTTPNRWLLSTDAPSTQVLRLHLADITGWRATIDGRPLQLKRYAGIMLEASVPAGHHSIVVWYWPSSFSAGIILAGLSVGGLSAGLLVGWYRRRGGRHRVVHTGSTGSA